MVQQRREYDTSQQTETAMATSQDPAEKLKELKKELQRSQAEIDRLKKRTDDLQLDVQSLDTTVNEVQQILAAYSQGLKGLEKDKDDLKYFFETKNRMVEAAIREKKEAIDRMIDDVDHQLHEIRVRVQQLREESMSAYKQHNEAQQTADEKQSAYDRAKGYQKKVADQISQLKVLKDLVTKADDATDIPGMYFLVQELKNLLSQTEIVSQHQLADRLNEALSELELAKENLRTKKNYWEVLKAAYEEEQKKLADKEAGRREQILNMIHEKWPSPLGEPAS